MAKLSEYFEKHRYQPKYHIGDRIIGTYQKIPFVGTVGNDTLINESMGPYVTVHLDLPIKIDKQIKTIIIVKHKDIKPLKVYNE